MALGINAGPNSATPAIVQAEMVGGSISATLVTAQDITTPATNVTKMSGKSASAASFVPYNTSGSVTAWAASDQLAISCWPH